MIKIQNLEKKFNQQWVLKNINIEISENKIIALLGPNGSGKTTFMKTLLGLVIPEKISKIYLDSKEIHYNLPLYVKAGYMPQVPVFPNNLKVKDLILYLKSFDEQDSVYFQELIQNLKIDEFYNKKISELSGGMKQKLSILQCFMSKREIYFLDEPTASLDPYHSFYLKKLILSRKVNSYILFTTHILSEVEEIADEMIILIDGEVKIQENPKKFILEKETKNLEEALSNVKEFVKI